ncbi:hypothetical protein C1Y35_16245 [Pseudomonas sp. GW456-L14]|uniref:hypothetical protein n=1 Tax=unclassified Pseudomonas TaxID=196821 RepID=UPI000C888162|nr:MULTISPECIES: hypothetical protein [unclassified Pseudomonas]PMY38641.1 hypothetical protein C1Y35_16245 [Pseudomonas sp. GW456-L14]PMY56761.1 hypothetical protein C1Y34_12390 [Pseudomonas sp. GW456-L12]
MNPESHYPKASTSASGTVAEERPGQPDPGDKEEQSHGLDDAATPGPAQGNEQEAEDIARKIAEIERKVADGN